MAAREHSDSVDQGAGGQESEQTGLIWPATWNGAYIFVLVSFVIWIVLLIALTECFA